MSWLRDLSGLRRLVVELSLLLVVVVLMGVGETERLRGVEVEEEGVEGLGRRRRSGMV